MGSGSDEGGVVHAVMMELLGKIHIMVIVELLPSMWLSSVSKSLYSYLNHEHF